MDPDFFVDAPLKSKSLYFLLNKNINISKYKTESKLENYTHFQRNDEPYASSYTRIAK